MKISNAPLVLAACLFATQGADAACRGSAAAIHAKCQMKITFHAGCDKVKDEVTRRLAGDYGWKDPHNGGNYKLEQFSDLDRNSILQGLHVSGNGDYTDLFEMVFDNGGETDKGSSLCVVDACSESQATSVLDFSTNYCNLRNLYCSEKEGCPIVEHNLSYVENYKSCRQRDETKCVPTSSEEEEVAEVEASYERKM
mmetsp:Transcript_53663/g.81442  ORF Transcript_53663/g.81442 Transcript_53663/m.81442 type:complete len:197 (-) Transcript_53663:115-705(-)